MKNGILKLNPRQRRLWERLDAIGQSWTGWGKVLVAGGIDGYCCDAHWTLKQAELFDPGQTIDNPRFDPPGLRTRDSFAAAFTGAGLTVSTYFDVRFRSPGSHTDQVVLNRQQGISMLHTIPTGTAAGIWTITGVRPHETADDHSADFTPVSAALTVLP